MKDLCRYFDHTLLRADASEADAVKLFEEAAEYGFYGVCVDSGYIPLARECLKGTSVSVVTVVGFPLGSSSSAAKAAETTEALKSGADEIDCVINIGALKDGRYGYLSDEIKLLSDICKDGGAKLKTILETCLLTDEEIVTSCGIAVEAGADFIKTSTGFSTGGAEADTVRLIRKTVGDGIGVKASGGIRTLDAALAMIDAGADRLGCSASVSIMKEYMSRR